MVLISPQLNIKLFKNYSKHWMKLHCFKIDGSANWDLSPRCLLVYLPCSCTDKIIKFASLETLSFLLPITLQVGASNTYSSLLYFLPNPLLVHSIPCTVNEEE